MTKAAPDLSEFHVVAQPTTCKVRSILAALDPERSAKLAGALADPAITHRSIESVLRKWGQPCSDSIIGHHRRGRCSCD